MRYNIAELMNTLEQDKGNLNLAQTQEPPLPPPTPTASEGVHPLQISLEEGLFAIPQESMCGLLQKILSLKYTKIIAYINYGDRIRAHFRDSIYNHFQKHIEDERKNAYDLAMKITAMGGEPLPKVSTPTDVGHLHTIFITLLEYEKEAISLARKALSSVGENIALKSMLEQMIMSDSHHADDMRRMLLCEG